MFMQKCVLRRQTLPILPCDCKLCEWYILDSAYNNCFWVLATAFELQPGSKLTFEKIAELEGLTLEEVLQFYESAMGKIRKSFRKSMKSDNFNDIN